MNLTHCTLLLVLALGNGNGQGKKNDPAPGPPDPYAAQLARRVTILVQPGTDVQALADAYGLELLSGSPAHGLYQLEASSSWTAGQVQDAIDLLGQEPDTVFAESDRGTETPPQCEPNEDPSAQPCSIGIVDGGPGQAGYETQWALTRVRAPEAQALFGGGGTLVAVVDTGVSFSHPVLQGRIDAAGGQDYVEPGPVSDPGDERADQLDNDGDGLVDEAHGHGTHVAGMIAVIDPGATILPLRVLDSDGHGSAYDVARAIHHAVDYGAAIVNLSLSMDTPSDAVAAALKYAEANGVTVFTAAGNTGSDDPVFPASYDPADFPWSLPGLPNASLDGAEVLSVTALDPADAKAGFAAWGPHVDLAAPGVDVYGPFPLDTYSWWSGTSMATSVASGVGSLALSTGEDPPALPLWLVLTASADPVDAPNPAYAGLLGQGCVDALAATLLAQ